MASLEERINAVIAWETSGITDAQRRDKDDQTVEVSIGCSRIFDVQGNVVGLAAVHRDVSSYKLAEKAQRDMAVIEERARLAREIRDTIVQSLSVLVLRLELTEETSESDPAATRSGLASVRVAADRCVEDVRRSIWDLQPQALESSSLLEAVQGEMERLRENNIKVDLRVSGAETIEIDRRNKSAAFRVIQEALNNIINHSQAKSARVSLDFDLDELRITIADDGIGFEPARTQPISTSGGGFGITSMQDRARLAGGSLQVQSAPGQGTTALLL